MENNDEYTQKWPILMLPTVQNLSSECPFCIPKGGRLSSAAMTAESRYSIFMQSSSAQCDWILNSLYGYIQKLVFESTNLTKSRKWSSNFTCYAVLQLKYLDVTVEESCAVDGQVHSWKLRGVVVSHSVAFSASKRLKFSYRAFFLVQRS
jgi:hypothetical protein